MARKMNRKTRNVISGILVGVASIFAVINFADVPADQVRGFLLSTTLFFLVIVILALLAVSVFKLLGWLKAKVLGSEENGSLPQSALDDKDANEEANESSGDKEGKA